MFAKGKGVNATVYVCVCMCVLEDVWGVWNGNKLRFYRLFSAYMSRSRSYLPMNLDSRAAIAAFTGLLLRV